MEIMNTWYVCFIEGRTLFSSPLPKTMLNAEIHVYVNPIHKQMPRLEYKCLR